MQFWWVSQNKTYKDEREHGYLWAPKKNSTGQSPYHWTNVCDVQPGDLIFSYYRQHIISISIAKTGAYDAPIPREWENVHDWTNDGWKVDVEYSDIKIPPHIKDFNVDIKQFLPDIYSPLTVEGTGVQGYLFELPETAGEFLLDHLNWEKAISQSDSKSGAVGTDKSSLTKTRVGQSLFRKRQKAYWHERCAVTGAETVKLLRASHTIPWKHSSPEDRVNVYNGFLLSPAYDAAFDAYLISFNDDGSLVSSPSITPMELEALGLDTKARLRKIEPAHLPFLKVHRMKMIK